MFRKLLIKEKKDLNAKKPTIRELWINNREEWAKSKIRLAEIQQKRAAAQDRIKTALKNVEGLKPSKYPGVTETTLGRLVKVKNKLGDLGKTRELGINRLKIPPESFNLIAKDFNWINKQEA